MGSDSALSVDRSLLGTVEAMVRRRVPASDVDDVVQAALADAVASPDAPREPEAFRRWLTGVVRHKVADFHRRNRRELALDDAPEVGTESTGHEDRDLLRWARRQLPPSADAEKTLEWMMHEADGEKLESIAERERMPAARVRQRVSRLRAFFRERWHRELAMALVAMLLVALAWVVSRAHRAPPIAHDPSAPSAAPTIQAPPTPAPIDSAAPAPLYPALDPSATPSATAPLLMPAPKPESTAAPLSKSAPLSSSVPSAPKSNAAKKLKPIPKKEMTDVGSPMGGSF